MGKKRRLGWKPPQVGRFWELQVAELDAVSHVPKPGDRVVTLQQRIVDDPATVVYEDIDECADTSGS